MRLYLAGVESHVDMCKRVKPPYVLMSYAGLQKNKNLESKLEYVMSEDCKDWLLDSGAFTYFNNGQEKTIAEWERYIDGLTEVVNATKCKHFFELDIDRIVGLEQVEKFRERIERRTGKQCIPVWHSNRGFDYFKRMCAEYDYVSIGGIAKNPNGKKIAKLFPYFIDYAHKTGTKIHGLGYTDFKGLSKLDFDSVDSTTWLVGAQYCEVFEVGPYGLKRVPIKQDGKKGDGKKLTEYCMQTFTQYSKMIDNRKERWD